ncbi:MAG: FeoA family protein [Bacillota bacterium]
MTPLTSIRIGENFVLKEVRTDAVIKKLLAERGLTVGTKVRIDSSHTDGSFVIAFRGTKLAIDKELAVNIIMEDV